MASDEQNDNEAKKRKKETATCSIVETGGNNVEIKEIDGETCAVFNAYCGSCHKKTKVELPSRKGSVKFKFKNGKGTYTSKYELSNQYAFCEECGVQFTDCVDD